MPSTRKSYPPTLKARLSVEAIKAQKTVTELAQLYHVNPNLIAKWKKQALAPSSFACTPCQLMNGPSLHLLD